MQQADFPRLLQWWRPEFESFFPFFALLYNNDDDIVEAGSSQDDFFHQLSFEETQYLCQELKWKYRV